MASDLFQFAAHEIAKNAENSEPSGISRRPKFSPDLRQILRENFFRVFCLDKKMNIHEEIFVFFLRSNPRRSKNIPFTFSDMPNREKYFWENFVVN